MRQNFVHTSLTSSINFQTSCNSIFIDKTSCPSRLPSHFFRTSTWINNLFDTGGRIKKLTRHVRSEGSRALGHWRQTCGSFKSQLVWLQSECVSVCGPALEASRFASSKSKRAVVTSRPRVPFMFWFCHEFSEQGVPVLLLAIHLYTELLFGYFNTRNATFK